MSKCPKCRAKSEVLRTETGEAGTRRRRMCLAPACAFKWTTVEHAYDGMPVIERPESALSVGVWNRRVIEAPAGRQEDRGDLDALAAARSVDARKKKFEREAEERRRKAEDEFVLEDGFDRVTHHQRRHEVMREVRGFNSGFDREDSDGWET